MAGVIPVHHAVKAFTIVDAMLELAEAYVAELDESRLEPPPWRGDEPIGSPQTVWGPVPGTMSSLAPEENAEELESEVIHHDVETR